MLKKIIQRLPIAHYPYKSFMHKHKCIFIHIPKNAGSSVLKLFNDKGGRKHAKWIEFHESNSYFFHRYHKFAIVREPLDRLFSAYNYCLKGGNKSPNDLILMNKLIKSSSDFNSFILQVLTADFLMQNNMFTPQYLYIFDPNLKLIVDTLLRYETLAEDWRAFASEQNFQQQLPWDNKGRTDKQNIIISDEAMEKVTTLYQLDYKLLEYPRVPGNN